MSPTRAALPLALLLLIAPLAACQQDEPITVEAVAKALHDSEAMRRAVAYELLEDEDFVRDIASLLATRHRAELRGEAGPAGEAGPQGEAGAAGQDGQACQPQDPFTTPPTVPGGALAYYCTNLCQEGARADDRVCIAGRWTTPGERCTQDQDCRANDEPHGTRWTCEAGVCVRWACSTDADCTRGAVCQPYHAAPERPAIP
jgi:hypothetical protein